MYERGLDSAPPLREEAEVHGVLPRALPRQVHPVRSGLVRSGLVRSGLVWPGLVWPGLVWGGVVGPDGIGDVQDPLAGAEVALQLDHRGVGEVQDQLAQMAEVRAPEPVDGLRLVAHDREPPALWGQQAHDVDLELVDVLVLVDQDVVEHLGHMPPQAFLAQKSPPVEEQVIKIKQCALCFAGGEGTEQFGDGVEVWFAPRVIDFQHLMEPAARIYATRVNVDERRRTRGTHSRTI